MQVKALKINETYVKGNACGSTATRIGAAGRVAGAGSRFSEMTEVS